MDYGRRLDGRPAVGLDIFKERNANLVDVVPQGRWPKSKTIRKEPGTERHPGLDHRQPGRERHRLRSSNWPRPASSALLLSIAGAVLLPAPLAIDPDGDAGDPDLLRDDPGRHVLRSASRLNILSMMGLLLAIGMLVDNAVVVVESIYQEREKYPDNPMRCASIVGTRTWRSRCRPARSATASCSCRTCSATPTRSASSSAQIAMTITIVAAGLVAGRGQPDPDDLARA